jgi:hypothetical protein
MLRPMFCPMSKYVLLAKAWAFLYCINDYVLLAIAGAVLSLIYCWQYCGCPISGYVLLPIARATYCIPGYVLLAIAGTVQSLAVLRLQLELSYLGYTPGYSWSCSDCGFVLLSYLWLCTPSSSWSCLTSGYVLLPVVELSYLWLYSRLKLELSYLWLCTHTYTWICSISYYVLLALPVLRLFFLCLCTPGYSRSCPIAGYVLPAIPGAVLQYVLYVLSYCWSCAISGYVLRM